MSRFMDFKAVKAAVTMLQVLEHYGLAAGFKRSGNSLSGPCPLHGAGIVSAPARVAEMFWI